MKVIRTIFVIFLFGVFGTTAYYLYQKQQHQYNYQSFKLSEDADAVLFFNLDRLLRRITTVNELQINFPDLPIVTGIDRLLQSNILSLNELVGHTCYISFTETAFNIAFNTTLDLAKISSFLKDKFAITVNYNQDEFVVDGVTCYVDFYNDYTLFSTVKQQPKINQSSYEKSNADYMVFCDTTAIEKYILTKNQTFKVWMSDENAVRGKPVRHSEFMQKIPLNFDRVSFYGSTRFQEDHTTYFQEMSEESVSWIDNGVAILQKDSFQILIAQQNENRDLKLMLEEQTLAMQSDSGRINFFTIKNFEIMPFKSDFNWHNAIPELSQPLNYYTEIENFNVLSNSIEAMRWYLAEIQTDNLFLRSDNFQGQYEQSLPLHVHKLQISSLESDKNTLNYSSETWRSKNKSTHTLTKLNLKDNKLDNNEITFSIDFEPIFIQLIAKSGGVLLTGKNKISYYDNKGLQKWVYSSKNPIKQKPQLIDLENDGELDIALFNTKGMVVLNHLGKLNKKLTLQNEEEFREGICMNYDNKFDYRFLLINGNKIDYFNENGQIVEGWKFKESTTPINSNLHYTQIKGKDYISFKDASDYLYVLNRRGEDRFSVTRQFSLPNEANFLTGKNEAEIRKLGYKNQYILSYFIKDGYRDSVQLDKRVNPLKVSWLEEEGGPFLVVEEASRIILFNTFGYLENEILKPEGVGQFLGVHTAHGYRYVFFNSSQNSLYLLDERGKLLLKTNKTYQLYGISSNQFCTYDGRQIKVHTLN